MSILDKARELGQEIANSPELEAMRIAEVNMLNDPVSEKIIREFEDRQRVLHELHHQGKELSESQKKEVEEFEQKMLSNDLIVTYFKAQQEFEKILEAVNNIIAEAISGESQGCECGTSACCSSCGSH
ncbi:YlbF family regulator [Desulfolucanica intricata]|uniref:YlbF family regulator n=1 Tax=Desulfolucanica intricata TaxID=1285191 RepID=UPI00082E8CD4|nr:YlbF family regulator [Desulfolucanica intricata]